MYIPVQAEIGNRALWLTVPFCKPIQTDMGTIIKEAASNYRLQERPV